MGLRSLLWVMLGQHPLHHLQRVDVCGWGRRSTRELGAGANRWHVTSPT
jgi:hypothetical protein